MADILPWTGRCPTETPDETVCLDNFDLDRVYHFTLGSATRPLPKHKENQRVADRTVSWRPRWLRSVLGR